MRYEKLKVGPFTVAEAQKSGLSSRTLYRLRDAGKIEQIGPGLYRDIDSPATDLDLLEIAYKAPRGTICLSSALARHDLIDMIPGKIDIALPVDVEVLLRSRRSAGTTSIPPPSIWSARP